MGNDNPAFHFHTNCSINDKAVSMRYRHSMADKGRAWKQGGAVWRGGPV